MLVKICGITNLEDAKFALDAGADRIGLNLVTGPRRLGLSVAVRILSRLDDPSRAVVLVRQDKGRIAETIARELRVLCVRQLQLYGEVTPAAVEHLAAEGFESIIVQPVIGDESLAALDAFLEGCGKERPSYVIVDAAAPGMLGGTGQRADWGAIARARAAGRYDRWPPLIIAGGLTAENVAEAIDVLAPAGVDVSSGVERGPGLKDPAKIEAFIETVRNT